MSHENDALLIIQSALKAAKKNSELYHHWIFSEDFWENSIFLKAISNIFSKLLAQQNRLSYHNMHVYIQDCIKASQSNEAFFYVFKQNERIALERKTDFIKGFITFNLNKFLVSQQGRCKKIMEIAGHNSATLEKLINHALPQLAKEFSLKVFWAFNNVCVYQAARIVSEIIYHHTKACLMKDTIDDIKTVLYANEQIVPSLTKRVVNNDYLLRLTMTIISDHALLIELENSDSQLVSILVDHYLGQAIAEQRPYEAIRKNVLKVLKDLEKENTGVQEILNSALSNEMKQSILTDHYKEILKAREKFPLGFLYYLNIDEKHSTKDFKAYYGFIQRLNTYETLLTVDNAWDKMILIHAFKFLGKKLPLAYTHLDTVQKNKTPSLLKLAAKQTVRFFKEHHSVLNINRAEQGENQLTYSRL
jgi:hypothetical protein